MIVNTDIYKEKYGWWVCFSGTKSSIYFNYLKCSVGCLDLFEAFIPAREKKSQYCLNIGMSQNFSFPISHWEMTSEFEGSLEIKRMANGSQWTLTNMCGSFSSLSLSLSGGFHDTLKYFLLSWNSMFFHYHHQRFQGPLYQIVLSSPQV